MNLPNTQYKIGESFSMMIQLTPDLQKLYGKTTMMVDAVYRGTFSESNIPPSTKIIAKAKDSELHHIVEFDNELWINDLCGFYGKIQKWGTAADAALADEISSDTIEIECEEVLPDGPRPYVRYLLHGSKGWNVEGIKNARRNGDGPIETCHVTGAELFYIQKDGAISILRTHGVCPECNKLVAEDAMREGAVSRHTYPVIYAGKHCINCWPSKNNR